MAESAIKRNWGIVDAQPVVSILCTAYNHATFIANAIDSFLMQKTNFPFEIVVHDDASTDKTAEIINDYAIKFPAIIKPILEKENVFSKSWFLLLNSCLKACRGKYIALCEGDDYWKEPYKLQRQVNYLESHPAIVGCCTRYENYSELTKQTWLEPNLFFNNQKYCRKDAFVFNCKYNSNYEWVTKTLTMMYRKDIYSKAIEKAMEKKLPFFTDAELAFYALKEGNCACLNFVGGVYRINLASMTHTLKADEKLERAYNDSRVFYESERDKVTRDRYRFYKLQRDIQCARGWYKVCLRLYRILFVHIRKLSFFFIKRRLYLKFQD